MRDRHFYSTVFIHLSVVSKIYLNYSVATKSSRLATELSFTEVEYFTVHLLAAGCFLRACLLAQNKNKK